MDHLRRDVAQIVRSTRQSLGMTQREFAVALSRVLGRPVHQRMVSFWETGHETPRAETFLAVLWVGGLRTPELLGWIRGGDPGIQRRLESLEREIAHIRAAVTQARPR